ncbi:MAG: 5-formyltetrahydrofolate cyclo-ligase [Bacteroidaceae bacterium]|nr:5-formyltetrahydrofolate cyclo-ligase [Bacteroidaceae bacterium]
MVRIEEEAARKQALRQEVRALFKASSEEQRRLWSAGIVSAVERNEAFRRARTVMAFHPLPDEVDLRRLLADCEHEKRFVLPVVEGNDIRLKRYAGDGHLRTGAFGIGEPDGEEWFTEFPSIDLVLVPGVAFTLGGARLGRGKGYYDRFLPQVPQAKLIGVCFPYQVLPDIPLAPHDCLVHEVVTLPPLL